LEEEETEIYNYFNDCENVLIIRNEHPIYKLISISDVVIVYDSTTSVDSWLLNKTTIHLCYGDFGYSSIRDGSLTPKTLDELIKYLEEYFTNGHVKEFENKKNIRNEIIRDSFGNLQSKPSLMVADHIYKNLGHLKKKKCALSLIYFVRGVLNRVFYHCRWLPNIKVFSSMRQHYRPDLFTVEQEELYENMQCYYK